MVKHRLKAPPENVTEIGWHLIMDDGKLRLVGDDGRGTQTVITIYSTGIAYRHRCINLAGLNVDSIGRIKEYSTPHEAHTHGGGREAQMEIGQLKRRNE